jgi:hypothetical protein
MRKSWGLAVTAATAAVVLTPAGAATAEPARQGNAYQTIGQLEAEGYDVIIDRVGNAPIGQCIVTNVRNPQVVTQQIAVGRGDDREIITVVKSRSISVSLNCDV